jgi:signal transduction histidine kinase
VPGSFLTPPAEPAVPPVQGRWRAGIARRLEMAFLAVAAMTVLACGVSIWAFRAVEKNFVSVADQGFPKATAALRLKSDSQEIALALLALSSAADEPTRRELNTRLQALLANVRERIELLLAKDREAVAPLIARMPDVLRDNVAQTDALVGQRLALEAQAREILTRTAAAQIEFLAALDPLETAANADLLAAARRTSLTAAASIHGLMDQEIASLRVLLKMRGDILRLHAYVVETQLSASRPADTAQRRRNLALFAEVRRTVDQLRVPEVLPVTRALVAALGPFLAEQPPSPPAGDDTRLQRLGAAMTEFDLTIEPLVRRMTIQMIAQSDVITGNAANAVVLLVAEEVSSLGAVLRMRGDGSLLVSLIAQASTARADTLDALRESFARTQEHLQAAMADVKVGSGLRLPRDAAARIAAWGTGAEGIFVIRARQLQLQQVVDQVVGRNQQTGARIAALVSELSDDFGRSLSTQIGGLRFTLQRDTVLLVLLAALSLALSVLVGWLYVGRRIALRLTRLSESMAQIAAGNFAAPIPGNPRSRDEIASMADSLRFFRDRIAAQRELERAALAAAQSANRAKSDFLANMSHELRTPLNAVIGFSEVLHERMFGELNDKQAEYVSDIHSSGKHLLSLINDILDLSKVEAGSMQLDRSEFDVPSALENAMTLVRERAQRQGVQLHLRIEDDVQTFFADERRFKQVMLNLLSNAVKFTPAGGRVDVTARRVGGALQVAVADTGVGIAPQDQQAVFEQFRQVGDDVTRKAEGTGLGLALTQRLVELHGGTLELDSALGQGSTFTFTLPPHHGE